MAPVAAAQSEQSFEVEFGTPGQAGHYLARFTNRGARLMELRLGNHYDLVGLSVEERADPNHWVVLTAPLEGLDDSAALGSLVWRTNASSASLTREPLNNALWRHEPLLEGGVQTGVTFTFAPGTGVTFEKRIRVLPASPEIEVELSLRNSLAALEGPRQFIFSPAGAMARVSEDRMYPDPQGFAAARPSRQDALQWDTVSREDQGKERSGDFAVPQPLSFVGSHNKYFAMLMHGADEQATKSMIGAGWRRLHDTTWARANPEEADSAWRTLVTDVHLELYVPAPGQTSSWSYIVYAGSKDKKQLEASLADHDALIEEDLGFFASIASLLLFVLGLFHAVVGNWGWAIILLTLTVRLLLFPINRRSQTAMARYQKKMKRVQPRLDELKEKYANNPQKQRQEQAKIMQEEGAFPPLGGCLPMFLQIPVFIGLFAALRTTSSLRQEPFMFWIQDLSMPDRLLRLGFEQTLPMVGSIEYLNVLPPAMVVLWVLQQRSMPTPTDEQQARMQKMMMWMPVLFGVMLYNYAAGLSLYMITTSSLGIFEQRVIKKYWPVDDTEKPTKKKSGFMARLAEAQKQQMRMLEQKQQKQQKAKAARKGRK
ncbi:MAG: hypothetical protein CMJ87_09085 [Planctomycetes bacterium]|nr:hypothetical protein [Planctomycetota bacterium]